MILLSPLIYGSALLAFGVAGVLIFEQVQRYLQKRKEQSSKEALAK